MLGVYWYAKGTDDVNVAFGVKTGEQSSGDWVTVIGSI